MRASESNMQVVYEYVAAFNAGDIERLRTLFTPDATIYGVLGWGTIEQVGRIWRELHSAFKVELVIEDMIAEDEIVAARFTERGRFVGPFRGSEPTGKPYEVVAMEWFEFNDGKIRRRWGARDHASQRMQMGL